MVTWQMERFNGSADARRVERRRTLGTRSRLRSCKLCLVPAGLTPSSRLFYEALAARCVPLLLSDRFAPAFASGLPLEGYTVRAPQTDPERLPQIVDEALRRWAQLDAGVQAARAVDAGQPCPTLGTHRTTH